MATTCTVCKRSYSEELCPYCTVTDVKVSELTDKLHLQHGGDGSEVPTAFLVDLVSNRKIPITTPRCKVGRDDLNDIVISGDQSISRFHFVITKDSDQYMVQDSKSRHGTFLNGNQIAGPIPINDGDVLKVGVSLFWFVIENQAVGAPDQFSPVDVPAEAQEMKVSAGEKTTPYAPTREVDVASMTSLKEVLAQAKAKENAVNEAEMSKTMPPNYKELAEEKAAPKSEDKQDKADEKAEKAESKSNEKSDDKSEVKAENKTDEKSDEKSDNKSAEKSDAEDNKADSEDKDSKDKEDKEPENKEQESKEESKEEKKENGMQITASMLMEALEHESLSEVSKLDDAPKGKDKNSDNEVSGNGKDKPEEAESKEKEKDKDKEKGKKKKDDDQPSEKDLQGLFSGESSNLDKTSDKEAASDNNKDQDASSSDKIDDSRASTDKEPDKEPEEKSKGNDEDFSPGASDKSESDSESVSKSTLDKMADAVQDSSESKDKQHKEDKTEEKAASSKTEEAGSLSNLSFEQEIVEKTKNGAWSGNTMQDTKVPDWCSKYFASELNLLVKDLDNLNEQVRTAQNKIKEVENRLAATKSLRNTLLTSTGEDLVEACGKVLARLGFRVKIVEDDKQELRLESDDKVSICRIIWTPGLPERTHLGQLSIAQTRYWCEQGAEPKGILIAAQAEDKPPPKITDTDYNGELADYASKKNVLMFTTLQLLAMYKEVALNDGSAESLRSSIHSSNGWLKGYSLDPSDEDEKEPSKMVSASA